MKNSPCLLLVLFLVSGLRAQVVYDASAGDPNPITQGWTATEVVEGEAGNVGAVLVEGQRAWQIDDRLTPASQNNPNYYQVVSPTELNTYYTEGWELAFTFRVPETSPEGRFSGFTGFAIRHADAPAGWNVPGGRVARVGFLVGSDSPGTFFLTPQPRNKVTFPTDGGFHRVKVVGEPESDRVEWFVDGVSQGVSRVADFTYSSGTTRSEVNFQAGSSGVLNGPTQWRAVSLAAKEAPTVVINSDDLTISDGGVVSGDTFRGVPFTAAVYNGLARFLFAGDLVLNAEDLVVGQGRPAISLTVSGEVVIPEGAIIDVSATAAGAGPGGGRAGGPVPGAEAGDGKKGGDSVSGGAGGGGGPVTGSWPNLVANAGKSGKTGNDGNDGTNGDVGGVGRRGLGGEAGYGAPNTGGVSTASEGRRGARGLGRAGSHSPGGGGRGGPGDVIGREPGANGGNATRNGSGGLAGGEGGAGAPGGGGRVTRLTSRLTGGGGGASGQSGGGGGGGGGGGSGAGGGGGGGEGAAWQFPASGIAGRSGGKGGAGGAGGHGGQGGAGGASGEGGHGGGALEIIAFGPLRFAGEFRALGGGGQSGRPGAAPTNTGKTNGSGGSDGSVVSGGGNGGKGSSGGNGGAGGSGGPGGRGGGGAGGTIRLVGSTVDSSGMTVNVGGGAGGETGEAGRVLVLSDTGDFGGEIVNENALVLEEYDGPRQLNPHLSSFASTPLIPDLVNGAEVAGRLNGLNAGSFPGLVTEAPSNARAAVMRMDVGPAGYEDDFEGFDMLLFVNLTPTPLPQPVLGAGSPGYVSRFLDGGLASQEVFGGEGPGQLAQLEEYGIYATLIPEADSVVTFGYQPGESFVRQTSELANGGLVYLEDAGTRDTGAIPAPTVHPDPVLMLPEAGPLVNFGFTGRVQVNIEPSEAETTGVGWYLEGRTPVYPGGFVAEELEPGQYLLKFARLAGWLPPRDQMITVQPGGTTVVEADYLEAPTMTVGGIAPQRVREGDVLGFYLAPGTQVRLVGGETTGVVVMNPDGWFRYEPGERDRKPFELEFSDGGFTQTVTITPLKDLPEEQAILALEPVAEVPVSSGRDYTFIHTEEAAVGVNYRAAAECDEVTISGVTLIFEKEGDSQLYDLVHDRRNITALNLYADEIIIRDRLALQGTRITLYARRLVFEDVSSETAAIDTTAQDHTATDPGNPQAGGDITLHVQEIVSGPGASPRLRLGGANTTTPLDAGDSGQLAGSFDLSDFSAARGGTSSGGGNPGLSLPVAIHPAGVVPEGLAWIHPQAVRSVILYAKDIYYLGFMNVAGEVLREYQGYLEDLTAIEGIPPMPDADLADLQLAEQYTDTSAVVDRIADRLDYFGNSAGWVPLLSFEANFNLTEGTIGRAMRAFYLAHWLSAAENTIEDRQNAMRAAREALSDETDELKAEFPNVRDEIEELEDKAEEIDEMTLEVEEELRVVERRLEQKAEEIVADRNNVPFWKTALRTAGTIMKAVPFYQPALGAAGGALEIGSRIDEQEPLDTVLQATDLALQYQAANYDQQAQDIDDELNPPAPKSDKELERDDLRNKADNMRTAAGGVAEAGGALKEYLASREVAADEVEAELEKIRASDPQFNGVIARLQELMDEKERFARRIASLEDRLREIPGIILKNRIAMITLGDSIDAGNTVLDPQALSVVKEMEARNKDRLRRYFYLLAKSFEYRLLEPYREEGVQVYDPVQVLDKIKEILIASQSDGSANTQGSAHHVLSPTGFESLRSVLEEELALLSERIIEGYESGDNREQTAPFPTFLNESELECINKPDMPAVLNLHKRGVYSAGEEAHRIADLQVTEVEFALTIGGERVALDDPRLDNLSSATIDLAFVHSGLTRLSRKGQTYFFNHFRNGDPDQNPIRWTAKVNLLSGEVIMVRPSVASESLLRTLLGTADQLDILNFSRPGANADIFVTARNLNPTFSGGLPPAGLGVEFTRINLEAQLDYYFATAERLIDVRVIDGTGAALGITPRILFDDADAPSELIFDDFGRRDSLGMVTRSFREVERLKITAEEFYGSELAPGSPFPSGYRFDRWLDQGFNVISSVNEVTIDNEGQKRIYAIYERVGDLEAPEVEEFQAWETEGNLVTYEVEFSEDVVGVDVTDFAVAGQPPGLGISRVSGSGKSRLVTVDASRFPAGESRLILSDDDSILDFTGNSLAGDGPGNGSREAAFTATGNFELRLSNLQVAAGDASFLVEGFANRDYRVESSTTLNGDWSLVVEVTTNDFGEAEVIDEGAGTRRFYRVLEIP